MTLGRTIERYRWHLSFCRGDRGTVQYGLRCLRRVAWEDLRWTLLRRVPKRVLYWMVMQALAKISVTTHSDRVVTEIGAMEVIEALSPYRPQHGHVSKAS